MGVRFPPPASVCAGVVQLADTPSSEGGSCEFESHLPYQIFVSARAWPKRQRRLSQTESRCGFESRRAPRRARVAQAGRGGGLKPRRLRVRVSPRASASAEGVYAKGQSGLSFKQAACAALRVRAPPPLSETFTLAVAQTGRALHCECRTLRVRIPPADLSHAGRSPSPERHATLYRASAGSRSRTPGQVYGAVAEWLGTGLSNNMV